MITEKQRVLIMKMNKKCNEKFDLSYERTKRDAWEYISRNMDEFKRKSWASYIDSWAIENGYF